MKLAELCRESRVELRRRFDERQVAKNQEPAPYCCIEARTAFAFGEVALHPNQIGFRQRIIDEREMTVPEFLAMHRELPLQASGSL
jgi:hypothetical protein